MRLEGLWWLLAACAPPGDAHVEELARLACHAPVREVRFDTGWVETDAAAEHRFAGAGIGGGDLDGDGRPDLVAPGPERLRVFRQRAGLDFAEVDLPAGVAAIGAMATSVALADVDSDGDLDVYVARFGPADALLLNHAGELRIHPEPVIQVPHHGQSVAFTDLDADGWLDVVVAGHGPVEAEDGRTTIDGPADPTRLLYQVPGEPGPRFEDRSAAVDEGAHAAYTFVATPAHLDGDGRLDLLLANDFPVHRPNQALLQRETGFVRTPASGLHVRAAGMGVGAHDVNGDGWEDFVLPVWNRLVFLQSVASEGGPRWVEAQAAAGLVIGRPEPAWVGWGADLGDLDADGVSDLVVAFGHLDTVGVLTAGGTSADNALAQPDQAFRGRPDGTFATVDWGLSHEGVSRGVLLVDVDRDGWLDVVRRDLEGVIRLDVARCRDRSTVVIELAEPVAGTRVALRLPDGRRLSRTLRAGGTSLGSAGPPEVHFGLGEASRFRALEVAWPDGATHTWPGPFSANRRLRVERPP